MTIKKIALSTLAATMMTSSAFAANSLVVDTNATEVATELTVDNNVSLTDVAVGAWYNPSLSAGVQDGKILITLDGGSIQGAPAAYILNVDGNTTVGINPVLAGQNDDKLIFDVNGTINDYDKLALVTGGTTDIRDNNYTANNATMDVDMISDGITMTMTILDNVDDAMHTSNAADFASVKTEWSVEVKSSDIFDALIDAANDFKQFTDGTNTDSNDTASITVTSSDPDQNTTDIDLNVTLLADTNISQQMDTIDLGGVAATYEGVTAGGLHQYTWDVTVDSDSLAVAGKDIQFHLDSNGSTEIEKTNFTVSVSSDGTGANANYAGTYLTGSSIGAWGIYGYSAQIPNVRTSTGVYNTYINVTNSSSIAADAVFTILPKTDGANTSEDDTCSYNAGSIAKNTQMKYDFANILANSNCSDAVKSSVNFSVELAVPTEPNSVYVNAYTKNHNLQDFIVLPVYNSSQLGY